jgi:nicotinamidase-related amidase
MFVPRSIVVLWLMMSFEVMAEPKVAPPKPAIDRARTAVVVTDPQNDFLNEKGIAYGLFADNLREVGTIDNIDRLFKAAKKANVQVMVSPHSNAPSDAEWKHAGALTRQLLQLGVFARVPGKPFEGSGADFLARYKGVINDGRTVVTSPHKVFGPDSNDLLLQLRSRDIDTVILGGLAANLCTDSHLRQLVENGFRVFVVKDAVGAPGADAYRAALVNYGFIASGVLTTDEAVALLTK